MTDQFTCGKGLASNAPLLEHLSQVVHAMASVLKSHLPMLDPTDPKSERERAVYLEITEVQRRAARLLSDAAKEMESAGDLKMGRHTPPAPPEILKMRDDYTRFVTKEAELLDLIAARIEPDRKRLESMPGGA